MLKIVAAVLLVVWVGRALVRTARQLRAQGLTEFDYETTPYADRPWVAAREELRLLDKYRLAAQS